jgi:hypothetical protein
LVSILNRADYQLNFQNPAGLLAAHLGIHLVGVDLGFVDRLVVDPQASRLAVVMACFGQLFVVCGKLMTKQGRKLS